MPSLPIKTSPEDVQNVVNYLKTKATGAEIAEAKATLGDRLLDGRKLTAYELWGFIVKDGTRLRLTERGRDLSRASEEKKRSIYREIVQAISPYRMAIEWMFHQGHESVSNIEVAAHWHDHVSAQLGSSNEATIRDQALVFFQLAAAAGLGTYILGRNGSPTRLQVSKDVLGQYIGEMGLTDEDPAIMDEDVAPVVNARPVEFATPIPAETNSEGAAPEFSASPNVLTQEETRVFISHSKNMEIVDQVKTMLEYANLEFEIAEEEETTAIPVPDKVFGAMRRCNSAVICVTADDQLKRDDDTYEINRNVLIEIGAAFVLYDKKVILIWDRRLHVPSNLQGLYRCEFEGNELSWGTGMKFMKGVNGFKKKE